MVDFFEVSDTRSSEFRAAMRIYRRAFPAREQHPEEVIAQRVADHTYRLLAGRVDETIMFMAILWRIGRSDFILIDYVATAAEARGRGIGTDFFKNIFTIPGLTGKKVLLEVEDPACGRNREERERRMAFYQRMGAKMLEGVDYYLPPITGRQPTKMRLMVLAEEPEDSIAGQRIRMAITRIYGKLHHRTKDDPLLLRVIRSVPAVVQLSDRGGES